MRLTLRTLRQSGRTMIGKTVALALTVSLTLPPTFGVAAELERHNPKQGGISSVVGTNECRWCTERTCCSVVV
jgi:hypothetical protein